MSSDLDPQALRSRAKRGVVFLGVRAVAVQAIAFVGNVALARLLTAQEFGVFGVLQFVLALFTLLGDVGLGAALIQRGGTPTREQLSSVFWVQLLFGLVVVGAVFLLAPWVVGFWPDLPGETADLLRVLSVSFVLTLARSVPSVLLERQLSFGKLAVLEFLLTAVYYVAATTFAWLGYGARSLIWAVVVQALLGVLVAYAFYPWLPSLTLKWREVKPILAYGVAYQSKNLVGFANSAIVPLLGGRLLGTAAVGYITWAQSAAYQPLRIVQLLSRVNFPLLSRLQDNPAEYRRLVERGLMLSGLVVLAFVAVCFGLGEQLVRLIYGPQWLPALPVFYVFVACVGVGFIVPMVTSALDAAGKPRIIATLSAAWMVLNWVAVGAAMMWQQTTLTFVLAYSVHVFAGNLGLLWVLRAEIPSAGMLYVLLTGGASAAIAALVGRAVLARDAGFGAVVLGCVLIVAVYGLLTFATNRRVYRELAQTLVTFGSRR